MNIEFLQKTRASVCITLEPEDIDKLVAIMYYTGSIPNTIANQCDKDGVILPSGTKESIADFMRDLHYELSLGGVYGSKGVGHFIPPQS